ncbi:hypothetical protein GCM10010300_42190 [Streptomyces olivaceoviridis]|uniref:DUF3626 domain-containing protein n=1 Tax=Streptomyces olivaceoviridis TaxID=1921 RepID=UPI001674F47F|nr:DUF3626 domain-containing protein [Streptomyces olivaceoviridis]GGY93671.1 hypothetical protein GCM10010300_42190 [Streptomyces olivaceoviridis]
MDFRQGLQGLPRRARRALDHVAGTASGPPLDSGLRITLNFHPDRISGGLPILESLARDGAYHSQFVTGTSNGGLTAHPGGDRTRWESRIFGGAYDDADPAERPVYGALDFRRQVVGAAPRFGSSHLRLSGAALARATFCYPDSSTEPGDFGVAGAMPLIALAEADEQDALNDYIEAHVHGGVLLDRDVEALVLDASYRGTPVETAARRLPFPLVWHPGYRLTVTALRRHADYRGPRYADLGARIAERGLITPRVIGDAARSARYDLQALKMVWHTLARFGSPEGAGTARLPPPPAVPPRTDTATGPGGPAALAPTGSAAVQSPPERNG